MTPLLSGIILVLILGLLAAAGIILVIGLFRVTGPAHPRDQAREV